MREEALHTGDGDVDGEDGDDDGDDGDGDEGGPPSE